MSELIAAKAKGDLLERYESEKPPEDAEVTESEYVRDLLDRGLASREQSLYERVGLPARLGAQLEDERRTGETEADAVREVLEDGVEARRADALDAIGADDELREAVEARREEGEAIDDAVRRLLRETDDTNSGTRSAGGVVVPSVAASLLAAGVALLFAGETAAGGWLTAGGGFTAVNYLLARAFGWGAWLREVVGDVRDGFRDVGGVRGFAALVVEGWRRDRPVEDPSTPVERAANADVYVPVLFVVLLGLGGVAWGVVEAGLLPVLGPPGALLLVVLLLAVAYAIPAAMLVSAAAMLAVAAASASHDAADDATTD